MIDLDRVSFPSELKEILADRELVGHNLWFDLAFLKVRFQIPPGNLFDTMTAAKILTNGLPEGTVSNSLGSVISRYLGIDILKDQGTSDWSASQLSDEQLRYAAMDVHHLLPLKAELERLLELDQLVYVAELENDLLPAVIDLYLRGFAVDRATLETMLADAELAKQVAARKLKTVLNAPDLNVNSNLQLLNAFAVIGLALPNTNKRTISQNHDHPAVEALIEYRRVKSAYTEKMESLLEAIRPDGRIHSRYDPLGTDTGRFSCKEPNIQQVPGARKAPIRKAFRAPAGRTLIKLDYNQMELRAAMSWTGETNGIVAFQAGQDLHQNIASIVKVQRSLGKTINFGNIYGQNAKGFARRVKENEGLNITVEEAEFYRCKFFELYPGLSAWHKASWNLVRYTELTEVRTPYGRRRLIPKEVTDWEKFTSAVNVPIQGGCADAVKFSMIDLNAVLPEGTFLVAAMHDELVLETDIEKAAEIEVLAKKIMEKWAGAIFDKVPMLVEAKTCESWG